MELQGIQVEVLPTSQARAELTTAVARFRREGIASKPILFGSHRKVEGVLISAALYEKLIPEIESVQLSALLQSRIADGSPRISFDELVVLTGFDPNEID
jgi:hypothetical protein